MLFKGYLNNIELPNITRELAQSTEYLNEDDAKIALVKFLRYNPAVAVQLMTGLELYPIQEMAIRAMMQKDFFLMVCGRGLSKTFIAATFSWFYCVFYPGVKIGILSKSFRQTKNLFKYIEDQAYAKGGALLNQCIPSKPVHSNDIWTMKIGHSEIVALPLGDGAKLRGYRFNVVIVDELMLMPENVINEVILPFLAVNYDPVNRSKIQKREDEMITQGLLKNSDRTQFIGQKFIGLSSASYKFEFLYKLYKQYVDMIFNENGKDAFGKKINTRGYGIIKFSYEIAPPGLYNTEMIDKQRAQMSEASFDREYGAIFTDDSGGFFSKRKMDACTIEVGKEPTIEIVGEKTAKYILAIDPSFSKCFGLGTKILMYDGTTKNVENIQVGDLLIGQDSTPRKVLKTHDGIGPLYKVEQSMGINYICNENHILCLESTNNPVRKIFEGVKTEISIKDYLSKSEIWKHGQKGYKVAVDWPKQHLLINPYFLGLWLGDGSSHKTSITTIDKEIKNYLFEFADENKMYIKIRPKTHSKAETIDLVMPINMNFLKKQLQDLKLLNNKHIPLCYKANSRINRLKLLAGLIDSDGRRTTHGCSFCNTNKILINDVAFLTRSLGFRTSIYHHKSKNPKHKDLWEVYFSGNISSIPLLLKRKLGKDSKQKGKLRNQIKVMPIGLGKYFGFELDGDHKHLLEDFTVAHNSAASDHYAMGLLKLNEEKRSATLVHNYAIAGGNLQDHMRYFSYLLRYFNIVYVIIDQAGHWFIDECNASVIFSKHNLHLDFFESDFENVDFMKGLRTAKDSYDLKTKKICHSQRFSPDWVRMANEQLAAAFDHKTIWFAAPAFKEKFETLKKADIPLDELVYDNVGEELTGLAKKSGFIEHQTDLIDLAKDETALIEIRPSATGTAQSFQLPQNLRRSDSADKARKDNYTTLLLGNWAARCYYNLFYTNIEEYSSFQPFFIR